MASIFEATAGSLIGPTTGGTVTQATNKATAVTLNAESGQITMAGAELAGAAMRLSFSSAASRNCCSKACLASVYLPCFSRSACSALALKSSSS